MNQSLTPKKDEVSNNDLFRKMLNLVEISKYFMDFRFIEPILQRFQLRHSEFDAFMRIFSLTIEKPEGVSLKELTPYLKVSQPAASMLVSSLCSKGYVISSPDPEDRRRSLIRIAPKEMPAFEKMMEGQGEQLAQRMQRIPAQKRELIFSFIEEMHAFIKEEMKNTEPEK